MTVSRRLVAAAALLLAATATSEARVDLPPRDDATVHDLAGVVSPDDRRTMERSQRDLRDKTGVSIAVVTFPTLEGEALEEVLARAGPEWGLGREAEDRGIVVALAMQEHGVVIATGHGVEDFLPDARVQALIERYIVPRLQRNDASHALLHASAALVAAASQRYGAKTEAPAATSDSRRMPTRDWASSTVVILFFLALALRPLLVIFRQPSPAASSGPAGPPPGKSPRAPQ